MASNRIASDLEAEKTIGTTVILVAMKLTDEECYRQFYFYVNAVPRIGEMLLFMDKRFRVLNVSHNYDLIPYQIILAAKEID